MLKIYGADLSSPANKVRFVANVLGLEYEYIRVRVRDGEHRTDNFLKMNPVGKIPVISDDGFILFESNAITKYLCDKQDSDLYPRDLKTRATIDQWIDFASIHVGVAMGRVVFNRVFAGFAKVPIDEQSLSDGLKFLDRFLPVVNAELEGKEYILGDQLSLADITILSTLDPLEVARIDILSYPHLIAWRDKLRQEEFYTRCYKIYGESLKKMMSAPPPGSDK